MITITNNTLQDLRSYAKKHTLNWGSIQNNFQDSNLNIFNVNSSEQLENQIELYCQHLPQDDINYIRKRWFSFMCAKVDEALFTSYPNCNPNPNDKDHNWDFIINNKYKFDLKSTSLPPKFELSLIKTQDLIKYLYHKQSDGTRYNIQNRIFLVHTSYKDISRTNVIKTAFKFKHDIIGQYLNLKDRIYYQYKDTYVDVIFIYEDTQGQLKAKIY